MDYWQWKTDGAGLGAEEVCLLVQHGVALYNGDEKTQWRKGKLSITTHHLIYHDEADLTAMLQLPLEVVRRAGRAPSTSSGFGPFSSAKISVPLPQNAFVKLSFRTGGIDKFFEAFIGALERKAWLQTPPPASAASAKPVSSGSTSSPARAGAGDGAAPNATAASAGASAAQPASSSTQPESRRAVPRGVGIAGVQQASAQSAAMSETLKDVDDVMNKASALVNNIRRLRERNEASAAAGAAPGSETAAERTKIESIESTLGLGAMVTRNNNSSSDSRFHKDLALELHTWMMHERNAKLFNDMPVVPLIELFALYNKARGGDLVSPLDVLNACTYMASKMPGSCYDLVTLSSGRKALTNRDDSLLLAKLTALLGPQLVNAGGSAVQSEWRKSSSQQRGGAAPLVCVPIASALPRTAWDLKSVSDVQLAEQMQVATEVADDILTALFVKGYLCRVATGFDCYVYSWNIFVF